MAQGAEEQEAGERRVRVSGPRREEHYEPPDGGPRAATYVRYRGGGRRVDALVAPVELDVRVEPRHSAASLAALVRARFAGHAFAVLGRDGRAAEGCGAGFFVVNQSF